MQSAHQMLLRYFLRLCSSDIFDLKDLQVYLKIQGFQKDRHNHLKQYQVDQGFGVEL